MGCVPRDLNERLRRRASDGVIYTEEFIPDCYQSLTTENEATQPYGPALTLLDRYGSCANITQPSDEGLLLAEIGTAGVRERMTKRKLCDMFTYTPNSDFHTAGQARRLSNLSKSGEGGGSEGGWSPKQCPRLAGERHHQGQARRLVSGRWLRARRDQPDRLPAGGRRHSRGPLQS